MSTEVGSCLQIILSFGFEWTSIGGVSHIRTTQQGPNEPELSTKQLTESVTEIIPIEMHIHSYACTVCTLPCQNPCLCVND